jgi:hypothetical protein
MNHANPLLGIPKTRTPLENCQSSARTPLRYGTEQGPVRWRADAASHQAQCNSSVGVEVAASMKEAERLSLRSRHETIYGVSAVT